MWKRYLLVLGIVLLSGCASAPTDTENTEVNSAEYIEKHPNDPFEKFNRAMWKVNYEYLDPYFLRPISLGYVNYVPSFLRTGIRNFISNLEEPFNVLNNLAVLDGKAALNHFNRFWINSTFGFAGVIDIAGRVGEPPVNEKQFGDVLGYYDVPQGPYVMLPAYGPITLREGLGDAVDGLYPPLALLTLPQSLLKWLFSGMESRASLVPQEQLLNSSSDPYAFTRNVYLQNKAFSAGNQVVEPAQPDEELFDESLLDEVDDY